MADWKEELLCDIGCLPKKGKLCALRVSSDVQQIITTDSGQVVAAAASLGQGRIFVISAAIYFGKFKEGEKEDDAIKHLNDNVRLWVSKGKCHGTPGIRILKNMKGNIKGKVQLWNGGDIEDGMEDKMQEFIEGGGGFVHAMSPHGWLQRNEGKTLDEMPLYSLLKNVGIEYTSEVINGNRAGFLFRGCCGEVQTIEESAEKVQTTQHEDDMEEPKGWESYQKKVKKWRKKILHGVKNVPKFGCPGRCVVYGKQSVPIISSGGPENVIMAAGKLEKGRIVIFTQNGYLKHREQDDMKTLMHNVFEWVSKGRYKDEDDVLELKRKTPKFGHKKILLWHGDSVDEDRMDEVLEFVKSGGALVHAMNPWGWLHQNSGKDLTDMPLSTILSEAGLTYNSRPCKVDGNSFQVDVSEQACEESAAQNVAYLLAKCSNMAYLTANAENLAHGMISLSKQLTHRLADDIKVLYDQHQAMVKPPTFGSPQRDPVQRSLILLCDLLCNINHCGMRKIPCCDDFPGCCGEGEPVCAEREFTAKNKNFHSTGLYAKPGADIMIEISCPKSIKDGWVLRIGSQTDNISKKDVWKRWPKVCIRQPLDTSSVALFSPYGGLIYLENQEFKKPTSIKVKIGGAIEAPHFDLNDPDCASKWKTSRNNPGPWADIGGRCITFSLPSSSVREIDDPTQVMETWDNVVRAHYDLQSSDPESHRHQWVVCDVQPVAGYMHAGYPIETMMDVANPLNESFLLNHEGLTSKGFWGMFHELGHNMQRKWWTFKGTGEVTCNIFTLHAMDVIANQKPWIHEWLAKHLPKMERALNSYVPYLEWESNPGIALGVYAQLQHCFGWDAYKTVFQHYETMDEKKRPKGIDEEIPYWINTFSRTVNFNLCPLYEFWGFDLSEKLESDLSDLVPFLPDDEMTEMAPHRVQHMQDKYPKLVRKN